MKRLDTASILNTEYIEWKPLVDRNRLFINNLKQKVSASRPVSRVLSRTIIHLEHASPHASSNLPESSAGHADGFLFGLAPSGVYHAT